MLRIKGCMVVVRLTREPEQPQFHLRNHLESYLLDIFAGIFCYAVLVSVRRFRYKLGWPSDGFALQAKLGQGAYCTWILAHGSHAIGSYDHFESQLELLLLLQCEPIVTSWWKLAYIRWNIGEFLWTGWISQPRQKLGREDVVLVGILEYRLYVFNTANDIFHTCNQRFQNGRQAQLRSSCNHSYYNLWVVILVIFCMHLQLLEPLKLI